MQKELPQLFFISPPGNTELAEMGYINIPKIFKDPPLELTEVQSFEDGAWENTGPANFWVHREFLASKMTSYQAVLPLFPELLHHYVPWILCEYGLYCVDNDDRPGFLNFAKKIILSKLGGYQKLNDEYSVWVVLDEGKWRDRNAPIKYIRGAVENQRIKFYKEFDAPLIQDRDDSTGCWYSLIKNDDLFQHMDAQDGRATITMEERLSGAGQLISEGTFDQYYEHKQLIRKVAEEVSLSEGATALIETYYDNATTLADAALYLKQSKQDFDKFRQELHRAKIPIQRLVRSYIQK
jgi:hypothetical protein